MTDRQYEFFTMQQLQLKNTQRELEEFRSGERYLKLQEDHRCVMAGYRRKISNLKDDKMLSFTNDPSRFVSVNLGKLAP